MPTVPDPTPLTTSAPTLVDPATLYLSAALLLLMLASGGCAAFMVVVLQRWTHQHAARHAAYAQPASDAPSHRATIAEGDTEPWPIVAADVSRWRDDFGAPARPSVTARTRQVLSGLSWCPICVVMRCTMLRIPIDDLLPFLVGQQVYCPRHVRLLALAKYDASDPEQRKFVEQDQNRNRSDSGQGQSNGEN